jgi:hypothetical protein
MNEKPTRQKTDAPIGLAFDEPPPEYLEPDQLWVLERVQGVSEEHFLDAFRQAHIDLLASDIPLSRDMRDTLCDELASLYWPEGSHAKERKRSRDWVYLMYERAEINYLAAQYKQQGVSAPRAEAEKKVAERRDISVGALRRRRARYRKK